LWQTDRQTHVDTGAIAYTLLAYQPLCKNVTLCVSAVDSCMLYLCQIVASGGGSQMQLHAGGVPSYFQYPTLAGCVQPGTQQHIIQHSGGTVPRLCNGGVKFVLQPTATIPVAPPPPLCITSLVLTPVSGFQGKHCHSHYHYCTFLLSGR